MDVGEGSSMILRRGLCVSLLTDVPFGLMWLKLRDVVIAKIGLRESKDNVALGIRSMHEQWIPRTGGV